MPLIDSVFRIPYPKGKNGSVTKLLFTELNLLNTSITTNNTNKINLIIKGPANVYSD